MMETYMQMTIQDYFDLKRSLGEDLLGVSKSFVRIGYKLRKIAESEQYRQDGYESITEFAEKEYGLSKTTVSRFMAINRKYSVDGYSPELLPEFAGIGQSKLSEMLALPDSDLSMIQRETQRQDIRDLKEFNAMPEPLEENELSTFIREFFESREDELNELYRKGNDRPEDLITEEIAEILCPSGSMSFRKGKFFMMMYENRVCLKEFGAEPKEYTWKQFIQIVEKVFIPAGKDTYRTNYGTSASDGQVEKEPETPTEKEPEKSLKTAENKEKVTVAPAQLEEEEEEEEDDEPEAVEETAFEESEPGDDGECDEHSEGVLRGEDAEIPYGADRVLHTDGETDLQVDINIQREGLPAVASDAESKEDSEERANISEPADNPEDPEGGPEDRAEPVLNKWRKLADKIMRVKMDLTPLERALVYKALLMAAEREEGGKNGE